MSREVDEMVRGRDQQVQIVQIILHRRLVSILEKCGKKRGKTLQQLLTAAILEKADVMYREDFPE